MIKFILFFFLFSTAVLAAPTAPGNADHGQDYQLDLRLFKEFQKFDLLGEFELIDTAYHDNYQHFQLGGRYLLRDNLKLGLHARRSTGTRHDEDWIKTGAGWKWRSVKSRGEFLLLPEIDYKRWVGLRPLAFHARLRYAYNFHNENSSAQTRLGLSYHFEKVTLMTQYEANIPLNYSRHTVDEFWFYFTALTPITSQVTLGHSIGWGEYRWSETDSFPGNAYKNRYHSTRFKLNVNYYF